MYKGSTTLYSLAQASRVLISRSFTLTMALKMTLTFYISYISDIVIIMY